jgi:hypothetical protein
MSVPIKAIQQILKDAGFYTGNIDGGWGPLSQGALDALILGRPQTTDDGVHHVRASSFADPADVAAFRRCKAAGGSDQECFKVGDNGIGKWEDDCTAPKPMCALPPEDWEEFGNAARGKKVIVTANGTTVICELRDTMPHRRNIKTGAGIDLNPGAVAKLGLRPPIMIPATWMWA